MASGARIRRFLRLTAALTVVAVGMVAGPRAWTAHASRDRVYGDGTAVPARRVAVVPGAAVRDGKPLGTLRGRLETALALYRSRRVDAILVSGNDTLVSPEATVMSRWLRERGVPEADVWSDRFGSRTRATMINAAVSFGVTDAVICTQAPYVDRAVFLARHAGIDAVGVGLPTRASGSLRLRGLEALKTTLAFLETYVIRDRAPAVAATLVASAD